MVPRTETKRSVSLHARPSATGSPEISTTGLAPGGSRQRWNREDELAELLAAGHPFLRLGGLLQGKRSVDHRTERLRRQQRIQLFPIVSGAHGGSVDRDLLLEDAADILLRLGAAGRAAGDQPPASRQRADAPRPGGRADVVDHNIDAALVGDRPGLFRKIR